MNRGQFTSPFNGKSPDLKRQPSLSPDFIPFGYSSPLSSFRNNKTNNTPYNKGFMKVYDKSFSSPSSSASSGLFSPNNSNISLGSSASNRAGQFHNRSNNYLQNRKRRNRFGGNQNDNYYNADSYFHSSMVEDPWAVLEKRLVEEVGAGNIQIDAKTVSTGSPSYLEDILNHDSNFMNNDGPSMSPATKNSFTKSDESSVNSSQAEAEVFEISSTNTTLTSVDES